MKKNNHNIKKVLFLSYDGMTDPLGQSQVLPYLKGLSKLGYKVDIISFEKPQKFQESANHIEMICAESNIRWFPMMYRKSPPIISTLLDIWEMKNLAIKLHKTNKYDLVHCRSYLSSLVGLFMKRKYGCKFIFDMRGFWADERVDGKLWNLQNPIYNQIYRFFKRKEKEFLEHSDHIVSLTYKAKEEMLKWGYQIQSDKITVIPCCVNTDFFNKNSINQTKQEEFKTKLNLKNEIILSYLGSIGTWYMLDEMLDFYVSFVKLIPNSKFLFITYDEHDKILQKAQEKGIDSNILIQPCSREDLPSLLSFCQASIFFIKPTFSKMASSPTKQGELMSMGIPIFCNSGVGDTDNIVKEYHSGSVINNLNPEEYSRAIELWKQTSFDYNQMHQGAIDYFGLKKGVDNYHHIYSSLI